MAQTIRDGGDHCTGDRDRLRSEPDAERGEGGLSSFDDLYRRHKPQLTSYAKKRGALDPEAMADLALLDGFRAMERTADQSDAGMRRYLFVAVKNHIKNEARKRVPTPVPIDDDVVGPWPGFEAQLVDSLDLGELIEQLPPDQRNVVTHRFLHGLTAAETGRILGKDPNAVYQLQHRATRRLHRLILAGTLVLVVLVAIAVLTRQVSRQVVDSTPADVEQRIADDSDRSLAERNPAPEPELQEPSPLAVDGDEPDARVAAIEATEPEQDSPGGEVETADTTTPTTGITSSIQATQTPDQTVAVATSTTESSVTTQPPTTLFVVANDDVIDVSIGESISYDVLQNDGPSLLFGTVTRTSSLLSSVALSADGLLTGSISEPGTYYIMYRLNGTNDTSDLGQIRINVS